MNPKEKPILNSCVVLWTGSLLVWRGGLSACQSDGGQVPNQRGSSRGFAVSEYPPGEGAICYKKLPRHTEPGFRSWTHTTIAGSCLFVLLPESKASQATTLYTFVSLQSQITMVKEKLSSVQCMIRNREQCLKKLADVQIRPIQLVAPRPEPDQTVLRCKSPLFSPKHGTGNIKCLFKCVVFVIYLVCLWQSSAEQDNAWIVFKKAKVFTAVHFDLHCNCYVF